MALGIIKHLAVTLLFTACANQLQTLTPSTSLLTSETQGEFLKTSIALGSIEGTSVHTNLNENSEEIDFKSGKNFTHLMVMPQVGLAKRVDAFLKVTSHSPFLYGLKLQLFGRVKNEARNGSESFSIYMGGGRKRYHSPSEFNIESAGSYAADRDHTIIEMGAIYGRRIYSDILVYGRFTRINQDAHGEIKYEENPAIDGQDFELSGSHNSYGAGIVWYTKNVNIGFELTALNTDWNTAPNRDVYSLLFSLSKDIN